MRSDRLLKLADHLDHGELGLDEFDFSEYTVIRKGKKCGCAIGELPFLFEDWEEGYAPHLDDTVPCLVSNPNQYVSVSIREFFGLENDMERSHLFCPDQQFTQKYGGVVLHDTATRYEVAANIREFVKRGNEGDDRPQGV